MSAWLSLKRRRVSFVTPSIFIFGDLADRHEDVASSDVQSELTVCIQRYVRVTFANTGAPQQPVHHCAAKVVTNGQHPRI